MKDCLVSVLTPAGRGAVATVTVVGADATALVAQRFHAVGTPLDAVPLGRIVFGRWSTEETAEVPETAEVRLGGEAGAGEELIVARRSDREVEIHCHGGRAAVRAVVEALVALGCREVSWQDLLSPGLTVEREVAASAEPVEANSSADACPSRRVVSCAAYGPLAWHIGDALATEAIMALATARTERTAAILLDQYRGALGSTLQQAAADLAGGATAAAREALLRLERRADLGLHLTRPWRIVLAGRTNVGKSSLSNALLGYSRSIVFDQPGTTRDVVTAHTAFDGWPVELADTAGLRESRETIEAAGIVQARRHVAQADVVVLIFDGTQAWQAEDESLWHTWPQALVVYSKGDRWNVVGAGRPPGLRTSVLTGEGLPELMQLLAARLVPEPPAPSTPVPFTHRQVVAIRAARAALETGHVQSAIRFLNGLLGRP